MEEKEKKRRPHVYIQKKPYISNPNIKITQDDIDFTMEDGQILSGRIPILISRGLKKRALRRPDILFLVVSHYKSSKRYEISFITEDFKIYSFVLVFYIGTTHITERIRFRFSKIFSQFMISEKTDIILLDSIGPYSPIRIYLKIVQLFTNCRSSNISLEKAVSRIYSYCRFKTLKTKKPSKYKINKYNSSSHINRIWNRIINSSLCPWITGVVDQKLSLLTKSKAFHQRRVRILLYYAYISAKRRRDNKKCEARKILREQQKLQQEQQQQILNNQSLSGETQLN